MSQQSERLKNRGWGQTWHGGSSHQKGLSPWAPPGPQWGSVWAGGTPRGQQSTRQAAWKAGLGSGHCLTHTERQKARAHTGVESLKAFDPLDPLMWVVTCEPRQPDLFSALPGSGRPAQADFPSERLWAGAPRARHGFPGLTHPGPGPELHSAPRLSWTAFLFLGEEKPRELAHSRILQALSLGPQASVGARQGPVQLSGLWSWAGGVCQEFARRTCERC